MAQRHDTVRIYTTLCTSCNNTVLSDAEEMQDVSGSFRSKAVREAFVVLLACPMTQAPSERALSKILAVGGLGLKPSRLKVSWAEVPNSVLQAFLRSASCTEDSEIFYDLTNFLKSSNQVVWLAWQKSSC